MNLRSFLVPHKKLLLLAWLALTVFAACARKNRRVYDFRPAQSAPMQRVTLPYLKKLDAAYDKELGQYVLAWQPLSLWDVPTGLRFLGYNIYQGTEMCLFPRQPFLQVPPGVYSSGVSSMQVCISHHCSFAIAPVFYDQEGREIIGLMTVKKIKKIS